MYAVIHGILSEIIVNINNIITMYIASIIINYNNGHNN